MNAGGLPKAFRIINENAIPSTEASLSNGFFCSPGTKYRPLGKEGRFKVHNSPRPPQAPAASFKRLYRNCSGLTSPQNPSFACRSTSDRDLTFLAN
jgi:hypothetical protein